MNQEQYIDHEVRIRMQEGAMKDLKDTLVHLESRIHSNFVVVIGLILTSIILPVVLHFFKLT